MGRWQLVVTLVAIAVCTQVWAQSAATRGRQNLCLEQETCGKCVSAGAGCAWCTQEGYDANNKERCDLLANLINNGCDKTLTVFPDHDQDVVRNLDVRNAEDGQEAVQLQPQEISIKLRPNKPYHLPVVFRQAENYPVDLYYVMDLSFSMKDDKEKLAELGITLAKEMSNITKNFRLGFGSFVDKKTMPYVSTVPAKLVEPCPGCAAPYGFKNQLSLADDPRQFSDRVRAAQISGNLDGPEGGFDGIMQAIACKDAIGWRDFSRKMMLFSTDAAFHYAGDGKLGGIVTPCDGHCHLDSQGYYSESLNQDYPSISQLSNKIAEKKVNIIFAVTENQLHLYDQLSQWIEGSTAGALANDSSNIVELVKDNYAKISSKVELKTEGAENVRVTFRSKCAGNTSTDTASCDKLGIGQNVTFDISIEVTKCPADRSKWQKTFTIYPVGLSEKLVIHLDLQCECPCEQADLGIPNSPHCNSSGTYECGACTCDEGRYGKLCECDGSNLNTEDYDAACKLTNTSEVCEGKGQCVCGRCDCYPLSAASPGITFSGSHCQCDDFACDYFDGMPCGGPTRGHCDCGVCDCNDGFNGTACKCPIGEESCRAKSSGEICNGKGTCDCGACTCWDTFFRGRTCEDCPTCPGLCEVNKACVQCMAFSSGELTKEYCKANCTHIQLVDQVQESDDRRKRCQFRDDDDCIFYFTYEYDSNQVQAQRTKECPSPVNVLAIVLGIIAGIVLIGLLLVLLWKLLTVIHDRREYAKFEEERTAAKWESGENPIYKQATSTFNNPTYAGK